MRVTIREVAREAGVSVATVSRVLNGTGQAAEDTSARIREVAARLRYAPNEAARALIRSRTNTLGVLLPDLHGEFFSEVIRGIDQRARQHGFHLLVSSFHSDRQEMEAALNAMRGRVDALMLMSPDVDTSTLIDHAAADLKIVMLNAPATRARVGDAVSVDNVGGARAMVNHLLGLGYRRIAMIKGDERNYDARERLRGYRTALRAAGADATPEVEVDGDFTESSGHAAAEALLKLRRLPRAIFAANDAMAVGALSALRTAGIRVPEDIALAGFDDVPMARYLTPPLSSVHVPIDELGRRATELALRSVSNAGRSKARREVLRTALVVRSSCGAELGRRATREDARGGKVSRFHSGEASDGDSHPRPSRAPHSDVVPQ